MFFRVVMARIQQQGSLPMQVIFRPHRTMGLFLNRKPTAFAAPMTVNGSHPIAFHADDQQVFPTAGQPPIAGMVGPLRYAAFRPKELNISVECARQPRLAAGALVTE